MGYSFEKLLLKDVRFIISRNANPNGHRMAILFTPRYFLGTGATAKITTLLLLLSSPYDDSKGDAKALTYFTYSHM